MGGENRFDPNNPEDFRAAQDLAGMAALGAGAAPAEENALNAGIRAYKNKKPSLEDRLKADIAALKLTNPIQQTFKTPEFQNWFKKSMAVDAKWKSVTFISWNNKMGSKRKVIR
jgi:hypothetical protein